MGPSISVKNFQISVDILDIFMPYDFAIKQDENDKKYLVDLPSIARSKLNELGISQIQQSPICSYSTQQCFSHRRKTHEALAGNLDNKINPKLSTMQTGRMATVIMRIASSETL